MTDTGRKKAPKLSSAARILVRFLELAAFPREHVAEFLVVPPQMIDQFASGELAIPLDRQMALATLLIERVPELSRDGHRLRAQVEAAISYEAGTTQTHSNDSRRTNFW